MIYHFSVVHSCGPWWKYYGYEHSYHIPFTKSLQYNDCWCPDDADTWSSTTMILSMQHKHIIVPTVKLWGVLHTLSPEGKLLVIATRCHLPWNWHLKWWWKINSQRVDTNLTPKVRHLNVTSLTHLTCFHFTKFLILTHLPLVSHNRINESGQHWFR